MNNDMVLNSVLVVTLVIAAVYTVMTPRLIHSAIGLAIASAILAIIIFKLASSLAAVFELSVCAGLISAIFISTISLTGRITPEELTERQKEHFRKFGVLPVIVILVFVTLTIIHHINPNLLTLNLPAPPAENNVNIILWGSRFLDLFGQIVVLLAGAFGVVTFFREK
ncbi:MAG: NADH-quinone oxidoreductase subunit J [Sedimentisphaerales bacterium]